MGNIPIIPNIPNQEEYKNLQPFDLVLIQKFPFIEEDFDAINTYGIINKIKDYLNNVIANEQSVTTNQQNVFEGFVDLHNYVEDYFINLDVQQEINNKLDNMAENGTLSNLIKEYINPYLTVFNDRLDVQDNKINGVESGSPLVASSISGMTNTSKVYVNTTDGYWYYYNGENWAKGGLYQASQPSDELAKFGKLLPNFCRGLIYSQLYITVDDTKLNIKSGTGNQLWFIGDKPINIDIFHNPIDIDFAFTDYDINGGIWALVVDQNKNINLKQINNNTLDYDDLIIMIFAQRNAYQYTLINDNLYYNGRKTSVDNDMSLYVANMIIDTIYGRCDVNVDENNITVNLVGSGQPKCFFVTPTHLITTGSITESTPAVFNFPLTDYDITRGCWAIIFDTLDRHVKIINLFNKQNELKYTDCIIMIITNRNTAHITLSKSNVYYNGADITINGLKSKVSNLENDINSLISVDKYDFLRCFKKFTFIGDSLTAGYTSVDGHTINSATAKSQNNNWPSYLCGRLNRQFTNLGVGSSTIHNWRYGDQQGQSESNIENANIDTDIYLVGLGVNDLRQSLAVGTSSDINVDNYNQNINSVYGNYDYIINKLKTFNPHAKIFVFTIPNSETNPESINTAIKYVANLYSNVYVIDLYDIYDFSTGFINDNFTNGHYNPITYNYMSLLIEKAINEYIFENYTEFNLVPYNYD